ncbi:MAG: galactokinase [Thermotogota bacterium]|nr:galactokinase [Thermotogota bacterium]
MYAKAPGRVNIIGEHVDYNDGFILPFAIDKATKVFASEFSQKQHRITSKGFETMTFETNQLSQTGDWTDYIKGTIYFLTTLYNLHIPALNIEVESNIPIGAGLSSSAAIEVASIMAISHHVGLTLDKEEVYKLAQKIENEFVGVKCGIMDQFISVMGKEGKAVFLDTMTMEYDYVPINLKDSQFYILDSSIHHSLGDGEYNKRRSQCESALNKMNKKSFRELTLDNLNQHRKVLNDVEYKRAKHVLTENQRVLSCIKALENGNDKEVGELLNQTHISLRDDYECSCEECDFLVEELNHMPYVRGARIMGGGFGGSIIFLAERDLGVLEIDPLNIKYNKRYQTELKFYQVDPSQGAKVFD